MKVLLIVCGIAICAAFAVLYQMGLPRDGFLEAQALLPKLALALAILPIIFLPTKWIDTTNKRTLCTAYALALLMPFCLWQFGYPMLSAIGSLGSGPYG